MSIAAITVDHKFQSRVATSMDHVQEITRAVQDGWSGESRPVDVFEVVPGKYILVDGFHRIAAFRKAGKTAVPATVHQGSMSDAVAFAAHANVEHTALKVTMEDRKKAARMLLDDPELFKMSSNALGKMCDLSAPTFTKIRFAYCQETGIEPPVATVTSSGILKRKRTLIRGSGHRQISQTKRGHFVTSFGGRNTYLGMDLAVAEARLAELEKKRAFKQVQLSRTQYVLERFIRRNVPVRTTPKGSFARFAPTGNFQAIVLPGALVRIEAKICPRALATAVGDILLWRQSVDPSLRAIVLCYPDGDDVQEAIRLAGELGVEFMTPEQVVEEFAGKEWPEGDDPLTPQPAPAPSSGPSPASSAASP